MTVTSLSAKKVAVGYMCLLIQSFTMALSWSAGISCRWEWKSAQARHLGTVIAKRVKLSESVEGGTSYVFVSV